MRVHAAVIAAVLILMAGCGDSDSDSGDADRSSQSAAETAQARAVDEAEDAVASDPRDPEALARLIRARFAAAAGDGNFATKGLSAAGKAQLRRAAADWERYLGLVPSKPDVQLAALMVQVFNVNGLNQPRRAVIAQEFIVAERRPPSASLYAQLALLYYEAGQVGVGDRAAVRAVSLSPPGQRGSLRRQLRQLKESQVPPSP